MAVPSSSEFAASNLTGLDIIKYYLDKPKELMKLFHQIGTKQMSSKEHKNGKDLIIFNFFNSLGAKWISDIVKNYVSLLLYATKTIEELEKLDMIKHYFALKIEKTLEEKRD